MKKKLGQVSRSQSEDICAMLREVRGAPHVELRVYRRSNCSNDESLPGTEWIAVPVEMLPDLLRMLEQTQDQLVRQGMVHLPSSTEATSMEAGEAVTLEAFAPLSRRGDARRDCRVPLVVPVGCRPLSSEDSSSSKPVTGETEDVSTGGAQIWISERFSLYSRVEVFMQIGGMNFQGRAQVVGAEVHPKGGRYRHSLKWVGLNPEATAALSNLANSVAQEAGSREFSLT
ncbi:MAG: PilZ domain-containing protein [Candidatus Methylomirabilales bacterium]